MLHCVHLQKTQSATSCHDSRGWQGASNSKGLCEEALSSAKGDRRLRGAWGTVSGRGINMCKWWAPEQGYRVWMMCFTVKKAESVRETHCKSRKQREDIKGPGSNPLWRTAWEQQQCPVGGVFWREGLERTAAGNDHPQTDESEGNPVWFSYHPTTPGGPSMADKS